MVLNGRIEWSGLAVRILTLLQVEAGRPGGCAALGVRNACGLARVLMVGGAS